MSAQKNRRIEMVLLSTQNTCLNGWAREKLQSYGHKISLSEHMITLKIRAVTRDFQQCGILTTVDSDKSVQPSLKLRNSN